MVLFGIQPGKRLDYPQVEYASVDRDRAYNLDINQVSALTTTPQAPHELIQQSVMLYSSLHHSRNAQNHAVQEIKALDH